MVELRKRKASEAEPPPMKKLNSVESTSSSKKAESPADDTFTFQKPVSDTSIDLNGFGGEIENQEGAKTTLKQLVDDSKNGVVLFTYPKASTPGCTTQACLFRDEFASLTSTGFSIYGLSTDSPKSNKNFKTKQSLPYVLLCDPAATLIEAIGMRKKPSGTIRGVFVVSKDGKVNAASPGGPAATVKIVKTLIEENPAAIEDPATLAQEEELHKTGKRDIPDVQNAEQQNADGDQAKAEVAAEVADTAQQIDEGTAA